MKALVAFLSLLGSLSTASAVTTTVSAPKVMLVTPAKAPDAAADIVVTARRPLACVKKQDSYFPTNAHGLAIGGYGFESLAECQSIISSSSHGGLVCSWTGTVYGMYNSETGLRYGSADDGAHWSDASMCSHATKIQSISKPAVCDWNGAHYTPYATKDNTALSNETTGWDDFDSCVRDAVETATPSAVCGWDGADFIYDILGHKLDYKFASTESCHVFLAAAAAVPSFPKLLSALATHLSDSATPIKDGTPNASVGFAGWKKCEVAADDYHLTKNVAGYLVDSCKPDTLYSWGGYDKYNWFKTHMPDGGVWSTPLKTSLFTTPSAAATFGYGPVPLRFKIKSNVRFKRVSETGDTCTDILTSNQATKAEFASTIFQRVTIRDGGTLSFVDYIICSPQVIASWSALTREHYDEIMRDDKWMTTQNYYLWEGYSKRSGVDDFIGNDIDGTTTDFSQDSFDSRMNVLKWLANAGLGSVNAPAGASKADHFNTKFPIYFNPN